MTEQDGETCESASLSEVYAGVAACQKLALSPRQCGKHRHNSLIVRGYQLVMRMVKWRQPPACVEDGNEFSGSNTQPP
jgi:hypothetical protein